MLTILKHKMDRAEKAEKMARLVTLRQPEKAAPGEQDWINAARAIGCPPAHLLAVQAVESGGAAFNAQGRLVIAYEPHVFARNSTPKHGFNKSHPHLSYKRFQPLSKVPPSGSHPMKLSQEARWDMLLQACDLDFYGGTCAASYGMWQILGENARRLGFRDPLHMIEVMYEGYDGQWECFIRFCKSANCLDALIKGDWVAFEIAYNGGGHKGLYARRLIAAANDARKTLA